VHYRQTGGMQRVTVRSVLTGPAGGTPQPSAPALVLHPGSSAYAAIGSDPVAGQCAVPQLAASLPNGVQLGAIDFAACSVVSYPLLTAPNGSQAHPESEAPPLALSGTCGVTRTPVATC